MILLTLCFSSAPVKFDVQEWLNEGGFGDLALYLPGTSPLVSFLVLFLPNAGVITPENLVGQISTALIQDSTRNGLNLLVGISQVHRDLNELHTTFKESSDALNQQALQGSLQQYFFYEKPSAPRQLVWNKEEEFLFRLEAGMEEEVKALTPQLFSWLESNPGLTLDDAKYYCYQLSDQCRRILSFYLKQDGDSSSGSMQNVVRQMFRLKDLEEYYLQYFRNIASLLKTESVYALDDVVEKIKIYIQRNYHKDLSQDFIASLFYINRSYLSTLFRQRTGMKFIDYLNGIRIEKAKEMLTGSDRKMYQISKAVGYDNPKYFFRIFKKVTGMTPEQYRESIGDET